MSADRPHRHLAAIALAVLVGAACIGLTVEISSTGPSGHGRAAVASVSHHQPSNPLRLVDAAAFVAALVAAAWWTTVRRERLATVRLSASTPYRRRGPPSTV